MNMNNPYEENLQKPLDKPKIRAIIYKHSGKQTSA